MNSMEVVIRLLEVIVPATIVAVSAWMAVRVSLKVLEIRMGNVEEELTKMGNVLQAFEKVQGRIDRNEDRLKAMGDRIDESNRTINEVQRNFQKALLGKLLEGNES